MDEQTFQDALKEILESLKEQDFVSELDVQLEVRRVSTFEQAGVLTRNAGLVVRLNDNSIFQVEIVQDHRGW